MTSGVASLTSYISVAEDKKKCHNKCVPRLKHELLPTLSQPLPCVSINFYNTVT